MRRIVCIFLLLLMPLHGFAMQIGWLSAGQSSGLLSIRNYDIGHEIEHLQAKLHHHHIDSGVSHYDDSSESATHFADHSACANVVALPSSVVLSLNSLPLTREAGEASYYIPRPILEHPQRPPLFPG